MHHHVDPRSEEELIDWTVDHDQALREKLLNVLGHDPLLQAGSILEVEVQDFIRCAYLASEKYAA
jgi:uncharacterized iron-regulated protein